MKTACTRSLGDAWRAERPSAFRAVLLTALVVAGWFVFAANDSLGQDDTADYFRKNCLTCHTIGGVKLTGPDLKDVSKRKDREWLIGFMMNPKAVIDSGDPYAQKIFEESRRVPMPTIAGLTRQRAEYLMDLIAAESKLEKSQFVGVKISNKPFQPADVDLGRAIFEGRVKLEKEGTSCISCHSVNDGASASSLIAGGRLGPDLTNVYERLKGRTSLSAWLMAPATETMQPIFKNRPMNEDEIHALAAYFEATADQSPTDPTTSRVAFLLTGLLLAVGIVFAFDAIWKRRFHSVRRPLVDASPLEVTS